MSDKAWYQDGWVVFCIVLFLLGIGLPVGHELYTDWQQAQKPLIRPMVAGRVNQPMIGKPTFELSVWHQKAGNLKNGSLMVTLEGELAQDADRETQIHSFEVWQPNRENAVQFSLPLSHFDPEKEISITVMLGAKNSKLSLVTYFWKGDDWLENSD